MTDPLAKVAQEYAAAFDEAAQARHEIDSATGRLTAALAIIDRTATVLELSVEPVCGSATKPFMRTFYMSGARALVVVWENNRRKGLIDVRDLVSS